MYIIPKNNDMADKIAKQSVDMYCIGPKIFFGVWKRHLKKELQDWEAKEMAAIRRKLPGQEEAKKLIKSSPKNSWSNLTFPRFVVKIFSRKRNKIINGAFITTKKNLLAPVIALNYNVIGIVSLSFSIFSTATYR